MNIGILGIGGVGGYFGGRLADYYHNSGAVKIILIARPSTGEIIRKNGLTLITPEAEKVIHPQVASDAQEVGPLDVLICATKSYDLEAALTPLRACITAETLILPLLNGVDAAEIIRRIFPDACILDGCVYINARRTAPGVIKKTGVVEKLFFGAKNLAVSEDLEKLQSIFVAAGIDSQLSGHIETDVWEKYIFIAAIATATSYFDQSIGEVLQDAAHRDTLTALVREAHAVAAAKLISLPDDLVAKTMAKMERMPPDGTSSMHSDFQQGGKTEYLSLTVYIARLGDELNIETPTFDEIAADFAKRAQHAGS